MEIFIAITTDDLWINEDTPQGAYDSYDGAVGCLQEFFADYENTLDFSHFRIIKMPLNTCNNGVLICQGKYMEIFYDVEDLTEEVNMEDWLNA